MRSLPSGFLSNGCAEPPPPDSAISSPKAKPNILRSSWFLHVFYFVTTDMYTNIMLVLLVGGESSTANGVPRLQHTCKPKPLTESEVPFFLDLPQRSAGNVSVFFRTTTPLNALKQQSAMMSFSRECRYKIQCGMFLSGDRTCSILQEDYVFLLPGSYNIVWIKFRSPFRVASQRGTRIITQS